MPCGHSNDNEMGSQMTKIQKQLKALERHKNRKISQAMLGKVRREIQEWRLSVDAKRSAYRQALRVAGHTDEQHIQHLADGYFSPLLNLSK